MLRVRRVLMDEFVGLDRMARKLARKDPVCRRLMTVPGVGVIVALTYRTGVDIPERFTRSRDVGAHFGLTPRRYSSGQVDYDGHISRCGDEMVRTALYQAAHVLMHHGRWSGLRGWAMRIAKRSGVKLAKVALARKLAVVLHRMWVDGTDFRWTTREQARAAGGLRSSNKSNQFASACLAVNECPDGYEGWTSTHRWLLPIGNADRVRCRAWPSIPSQPILSAGVNRRRARKEA